MSSASPEGPGHLSSSSRIFLGSSSLAPWKPPGFPVTQTQPWGRSSSYEATQWVTLIKSHNLSEPQFLHLQNGHSITHPVGGTNWDGGWESCLKNTNAEETIPTILPKPGKGESEPGTLRVSLAAMF